MLWGPKYAFRGTTIALPPSATAPDPHARPHPLTPPGPPLGWGHSFWLPLLPSPALTCRPAIAAGCPPSSPRATTAAAVCCHLLAQAPPLPAGHSPSLAGRCRLALSLCLGALDHLGHAGAVFLDVKLPLAAVVVHVPDLPKHRPLRPALQRGYCAGRVLAHRRSQRACRARYDLPAVRIVSAWGARQYQSVQSS